ncbi:MAG TPA: hypothetical protein VHV08_10525 [Pirellulales bacterium]|nr:hypothetical protein [Pirellulales bacterium]
MLSALLAANLLCGVGVYLQPQAHVKDVAWPTHAVVTLPRGWVKPTDHIYLAEDGQPIAAQIAVVAKWPDGSPKWVHAHAPFRYLGGKPVRYEFEKKAQLPPIPASPLTVTDTEHEIVIDTGAIRLSVARPFSGLSLVKQGAKVLINGIGGPSLVDEAGIEWQARYDSEAKIVVEQEGPAQVTILATGWYQTQEKRVAPFCRFATRISAFSGSSLIKIDHATIFADDMRKHAIAELAFKFPVPGVEAFVSGGEQGRFDDQQSAVWFAQLSANRQVTLNGAPGAEPRAAKVAATHRRSPGWFSAQSAAGRITLLTKDFWQKCPKEVEIGRKGISYYAWPKHGALATADENATQLNEIYKFQCFHTGTLLDSRLPNDYFLALEVQKDSTECKAQYARAANLEGMAMHNEFALLLESGSGGNATEADPSSWQQLYARDPIARVSPEAVAVSGVFGNVAALGSDYPQLQRTVKDGMLGYAQSIERYGDYGWAIYGNAHSEEYMNPLTAGVTGGRPSLHRVWTNNHYQHVSTSWRLASLSSDERLWEWARICSDYYASVGQVRYDPLQGYVDGREVRHAGPEVKYHHPGAFWHCKAFVPWGGRDYGMDTDDVDADLIGHWPDPSSLLLAWLLDANRWAKDGYDLWRSQVKFPTRGTRREINTTLVHAITAYEYEPKAETLAAIKGMARSLSEVPLEQQRPGPLWEPTWLSRYHELAPDDEAFNKYIVASADAVGVGVEGIWSLALSATAYQITKKDDYLKRHAGTLARAARQVFYDPDPDKRWDRYGFGPGPDRDHHFMLQWPRFCAALKEAHLDSLPPPDEPGQYFMGNCRWDNPEDIAARGTEILVWHEGEDSFPLTVEATPLGGGDIGATSLTVMPERGSALLAIARLPMSAVKPIVHRVTRPSSWEVAAENYTIPAGHPGLCHVQLGGGAGVFQKLTNLPECQVLRNTKLTTWNEDDHFFAKLARGYLVPLTKGKIKLTFTAVGTCDGSHISLSGAGGQPILAHYLRAGESVSAVLNTSEVSAAPWLLDAFSDHTGYFKLAIQSNVDVPLLFGARLEDIQLIRHKLGK